MDNALAAKIFTTGIVIEILFNVLGNNISGSSSVFSIILIFIGYNAITQSNPIHYRNYIIMGIFDLISDILSFVWLSYEIGRFRFIIPSLKPISFIILSIVLISDIVMLIMAKTMRDHLKQQQLNEALLPTFYTQDQVQVMEEARRQGSTYFNPKQ